MKKHFGLLIAAFATVVVSFSSAKAAEVDLGTDVVSSYVWRGMYQTGTSIQPAVGLSVGDFSLSAWGSTDIASLGSKEVDFTLGYAVGGFSVAVTDYWWSGQGVNYFGSNDHYYEAALAYEFESGFSIGVATMFAGKEDQDENGDQYFSTYIDLAYGFAVNDIDCSVGVGITPAAGMYADDFNVCSISLTAAKSLQLSSTFELPIFVQAIFSPAQEDAYLVVGVSF